jgi:glycosyltransferase involved in cell wall biosynthesis
MSTSKQKVPLSIVIPTKNEARNIERCLKAIADWVDEIVVVDSQSDDETTSIAQRYGASIVQFYYEGGWPKKRQWALDNHRFRNEWILLLDADEILLEPIKREIESAIRSSEYEGYYLCYQIYFLGKQLRFGDTEFWKLTLFRHGKGHFECRLEAQDRSMLDMEVHEHMIVRGRVGKIHEPVRHENFNSLAHYIDKHNAYSNWDAKVQLSGEETELKPAFFGTQAQKRRWLKNKILNTPGASVYQFLYSYIIRLGFLDGVSGLIYCGLRGVHMFHTKAKMYEMEIENQSVKRDNI